MLRRRPTVEQLRASFDLELANSITGDGPRRGSGLCSEVDDLMWEIADAHPDIPQHLIDAARTEFERQVQRLQSYRATPAAVRVEASNSTPTEENPR
ncbi:hypothetical protein OG225_06915 [Nocardia sp. NBC_01377]|uniref:hypothetical protein n=1 Tax=Nocardia sp. NBC_01377 TaxID=2903595 RepID=UPI0032473C9E